MALANSLSSSMRLVIIRRSMMPVFSAIPLNSPSGSRATGSGGAPPPGARPPPLGGIGGKPDMTRARTLRRRAEGTCGAASVICRPEQQAAAEERTRAAFMQASTGGGILAAAGACGRKGWRYSERGLERGFSTGKQAALDRDSPQHSLQEGLFALSSPGQRAASAEAREEPSTREPGARRCSSVRTHAGSTVVCDVIRVSSCLLAVWRFLGGCREKGRVRHCSSSHPDASSAPPSSNYVALHYARSLGGLIVHHDPLALPGARRTGDTARRRPRSSCVLEMRSTTGSQLGGAARREASLRPPGPATAALRMPAAAARGAQPCRRVAGSRRSPTVRRVCASGRACLRGSQDEARAPDQLKSAP